ncbi:putative FAD-binding oxidoreductase [Durotheca rogersii]|uniref:putative FAD-binding oxidoreductase n=1 Tax=Durotheca rogersii TaxID=419775 RepID=UPI00221ED2C9|nr:putative FAD-binding oxidoreductase [Durotheca rogersii]KAI5862344.1 putative FAD-binding oxidoreductase [Durotheca rogersii]
MVLFSPSPRALLTSLGCFYALAGVVTAASPSATQKACQRLEALLGDYFVTTIDEGDYEARRTKNWVQTAWGNPVCILHPTRVEQLQVAVSLLANSSVSFAVRSGGHEPHRGFANIDNGVLIDMSGFTRLEYDAGRGVAVVGTGLTWGEVYGQLEPHGVVVVGGRVPDVGVGGLILGSKFLVAGVVTADGSLVSANAKQNADLFWALKGGTNNFGIVTEFTLTAYPLNQVWGGVKTYTLDQLPQVLDAYYEYQSANDKDPYANLIVGFSPTNASIGALVSMVYLKPEEKPAAFASFYPINTTSDSTGIKSFSQYLAEYGIPVVPRFDWHSASFRLDKSLYDEIGSIVTSSSSVEVVKQITAGFMAVTLQPVSSRAVEIGRSNNGGNALGLEAVNQTWLAVAAGWWFPDDDKTVHDAGGAVIEQLVEAAAAKRDHLSYLFMNDASWDQDVIASYGEANNLKLRQVQRKYDPKLVFQRLVPGGFKIR